MDEYIIKNTPYHNMEFESFLHFECLQVHLP